MSNFYFCEDCKKAVDLKPDRSSKRYYSCKECSGSNWKAIIDTPNGETEEKKV